MAAALLPNPDLLFLDEPFEGVDAVKLLVQFLRIAVSEDLQAAAGKVRPTLRDRLPLRRNNPGNNLLALSEFHGLPCAQQLLQAAGVAQLANIN